MSTDPMLMQRPFSLERLGDLAMGVELRAIDVEEQLESAEAQGRSRDVAELRAQLRAVLNELAELVERGLRAA